MLRCAVFRAAAPAVRSAGVRASPARCLSTSVRALAEGDTGSGASRAGGVREGYVQWELLRAHETDPRCSDAFAKREHAAEEMYIMQEERQKCVVPRLVPRHPRGRSA